MLPTAAEEAFNAAHQGDECIDPCGGRWAVWPGEPIYDESRDRVLVFYSLIYAEPGDFNFRSVGQGIATWEGLDRSPERQTVDAEQERPTLLFDEDEPAFGLGPQIIGDVLHAFACLDEGLSRPCILGRRSMVGGCRRRCDPI